MEHSEIQTSLLGRRVRWSIWGTNRTLGHLNGSEGVIANVYRGQNGPLYSIEVGGDLYETTAENFTLCRG